MEIQVMSPSPAVDFNFDSTSTSPYATAPSSPNNIFGSFFHGAHTSPTHHLSPMNTDVAGDFQATVDFSRWEEHPYGDDDDIDFAFDFSGQLEPPSISAADELFDGGKIKTSNPPPRPRSPARLSNKKKIVGSFSEALHQTPGDHPPQRGRERTTATSPITTRHKSSRSLSPLRVENDQKIPIDVQPSPFGFTWYNKWNLKNLLLFRSTSEGSATTSKDPLKKYAMLTKGEQDVKNCSFRSTDSGGGPVGESRRRLRRKVSAHELHYTANRAVAEEMRRKTFLPYKSGLLGCLGFDQNGGNLR